MCDFQLQEPANEGRPLRFDFDLFVADARAISIEEAAKRVGLKFTGGRHEICSPCPHVAGPALFHQNR